MKCVQEVNIFRKNFQFKEVQKEEENGGSD